MPVPNAEVRLAVLSFLHHLRAPLASQERSEIGDVVESDDEPVAALFEGLSARLG